MELASEVLVKWPSPDNSALRTAIDVIKGSVNNWSQHGKDDEETEEGK
jgi:hypothetical protein